MAVVTVSRGTLVGGQELATHLAEKLGYTYVSREDLTEKATKLGVPVGKLQMAMVKPPRVYQRLGRERGQYLACMTMLLCEKALEGDIVYCGHTGHLLFPGVPNILRIRVLADPEYRITSVIQRLKLSRVKAKQYIQNVDADRDKWVKFLYGVDWHNPFNYDLVIHLDQMGLNNAASALCALAELPDFKLSPASIKAIKNLLLSSKAHFALSSDHRTNLADVRVSADDGIVQVIYLPQQSEVVPYVQEVLSSVPGIKDVNTTIAQSSILFLQDEFEHDAGGFADVVKVAKKWDAAVELMRFALGGVRVGQAEVPADQVQPGPVETSTEKEYDGGIEEDVEGEKPVDEELSRCLDELRKQGCSGGSSAFRGDGKALLTRLQRTSYSMVVLGDLFKDKPAPTRTRLKGELKNFLADNTDIPVIDTTELQEQFRFGLKQFVRLALALVIAFVIFAGLFTHQKEVISFLSAEEYRHLRILAVLFVVLLTPLFAYSYGTFARQLLKLFR
ncbi:MAG: cytidylate kinase-like family protein, partial [Candidatus Zixiibacteriota bacterium]